MAVAWDDFTQGANALLENHTPTGTNAGAGWVVAVAGGSINDVAATGLITDVATGNGNRYRMTTDLKSDEMDVQLDVTVGAATAGVSALAGVGARMPSAGGSGVEFYYDWSISSWGLWDGTTTTTFAQAWPGGTVTVLFKVRSGRFEGYANGVLKISVATNGLAGNNYAGVLFPNFSGTAGQVKGDTFKATGVPKPVFAPSQRRVVRPALVRKSRVSSVVPKQQNPPTIPTVTHSRAYRGARRVRPISTFVVPKQQNPPNPIVAHHQSRAVRGWKLIRGQYRSPVPPQRNPPLPPPAYHQMRAVRGWKRITGQTKTPVPPQVNPPLIPQVVKQARAVRGWLRRPGKSTFVVPTQTAAVPSPFIPQPARRIQRAIVGRVRHVDVVPAQAAPLSAPKVGRAKAAFRKARPVETVPPQFNPPIVHNPTQRRPARGFLRRAKPVAVVPSQSNPSVVPTQRRPARGFLRKARPVEVVPSQQNPLFVAPIVKQARAVRGWLRRPTRTTFVTPSQANLPNAQRPRRVPPTRRVSHPVEVVLTLTVRSGSVSGSTATSGTVTGQAARLGTASGSTSTSGTATGQGARFGSVAAGTATSGTVVGRQGDLGLVGGITSTTGTVTGRAARSGFVIISPVVPSGTATGSAARFGSVAASSSSSGSVTGTRSEPGSGAASGSTTSTGTVSGTSVQRPAAVTDASWWTPEPDLPRHPLQAKGSLTGTTTSSGKVVGSRSQSGGIDASTYTSAIVIGSPARVRRDEDLLLLL